MSLSRHGAQSVGVDSGVLHASYSTHMRSAHARAACTQVRICTHTPTHALSRTGTHRRQRCAARVAAYARVQKHTHEAQDCVRVFKKALKSQIMPSGERDTAGVRERCAAKSLA